MLMGKPSRFNVPRVLLVHELHVEGLQKLRNKFIDLDLY
jgi:hypothetical protein